MKLRFTLVATLATLVLAGLAACTGSGQGTTSSAESSNVQIAGGEGIVSVALDYSAGTGFEWDCVVSDDDPVLSIVDEGDQGLSDDETTTGGPLRHWVTLRAVAPGHDVLVCQLVRPWEDGEPAEVQTFDFTVDSNLQITFNAEASSYRNEPEWGSNS
ncbi:MAG: protease inhibitor I42 family protein [Eggerthellaceae bacterium]|nr:protease inhibitor I42 family protein [Eggerthellaceae bacterium]